MRNINKPSSRGLLITYLVLRAYTCAYGTQSITPPDGHTTEWQTAFMQLSSTEELETDAWKEAFEVLTELEQSPLNINTATREDLQRIPFLTDQQIEDIQAYVYQYGGMQTLSELAMIESLDRPHQMLLSCFVYAGTTERQHFPKLKDIARYGKQQLVLDGNIPFYRRHGDSNGYLGYPYRHTLRYDFHYGELLKVGFLGAQDAGEPFFANRNTTGYDHYSFYAVLRNIGRLKAVAVGRYKLRTGMGLVLNNDFGFGKTMMLSSLSRTPSTIRAYTSRSSANYLQGAAATVTLTRQVDLTAFYSYRHIDATLTKDGDAITTIRTDGYHRTKTEMEKKDNATQTTYGANIHWSHKRLHAGITALATSFDKPLAPNTAQRYRLYYASGQRFWNASIDYGYRSRLLTVSGEAATGDSHALATINMAMFQPSGDLRLTLLHRLYSYRYTALLAESFNEGGYIQNEHGAYLGIWWKPTRHLLLQAYSDYAYFPWMRYQVSNASHAWDNYLSAAYSLSDATIGASYRLKIRQKDNEDKTALIDDRTQRVRLFLNYSHGPLSMKTQLDGAWNRYKKTSRGWMVSQMMTYRWRERMQVTGTIGYFHTTDYSSRIYTYERGLLYSLSFPANYGEGIRYSLFINAAVTPSLLVVAKLSTTDYFDRDHISSSYQQIDHSSKTDLELQLRWKFSMGSGR